ncbi:unnamed protein product [Camellia sinensis]
MDAKFSARITNGLLNISEVPVNNSDFVMFNIILITLGILRFKTT